MLQDLTAAATLTAIIFEGVTFYNDPGLPAILEALPGLQRLNLSQLKVKDCPEDPITASTTHAAGLTASKQLWLAQCLGNRHNGNMQFTDEGVHFICRPTTNTICFIA